MLLRTRVARNARCVAVKSTRTGRFGRPGSPFSSSSPLQDELETPADPHGRSATYHVPTPFTLENGSVLDDVQVAYTTYGQLNAARDNAIVICHPLTSNSFVHEWWGAMVAPEWTDRYFIVCANILGSCLGTTGPASIHPVTQRPYGPSFPRVTMRDAVQLHKRLVQEELGIQKIQSVIGGSLGGMQTLEWALLAEPDYVKSIVSVAANSHHSAWQIGMLEMQRQAIYMDPLFQGGHYDPQAPPRRGLALARETALISYRTHEAYRTKFGREQVREQQEECRPSKHPRYQVQSYLAYQGQKFMSTFDANSYLTLSHLADSHDVGRGRGGIAAALATIEQPALIIGIESDVLYPLVEQRELAEALPTATFEVLNTINGHDDLFIEQETISRLARAFLDQQQC
ncbi:hypothetical protein Poli38472_008214 [Pythium oligandrum]|uniref:AB hydrolase-1 domain-containing protein n=1 Tax=Pythium oligandrum TaxID=41045 RepID=A0A8K1CLB0_PYTOL|nr:hypothetical protein Poli38472_008214 [Pythium oligandrum]|eukprot:TMW65572.1 hypothetical protein Poli38472_008214 [Pythium oligandrum]